MFKRLAKMLNRAAARRRCQYWGDMLEMYCAQKRSVDGNIEVAGNELAAAKRDLYAIDAPPVRVSRAGTPPRDGVRRFSLLEDKPATR